MSSAKDKAKPSRKSDNRTSGPARSGHKQPDWRLWALFVSTALLLFAIGWWFRPGFRVQSARPDPPQATVPSAEVQAAVRRARQSEHAGDDAGLERELQSLIDLQPDNVEWRLKLSKLQRRQGRSTAAVETCQQGLARNGSDKDSRGLRMLLADESIKLGNAEDAREALEPLLAAGADDPLLLPLWAKVLRLEGRSDEALEYLGQVLLPNHGNASAYQLIGMLEFDLGHYVPALENLRESARLDPFSDVTHFKLAECARIAGDHAAEKTYREAYARLHAVRLEIDALLNRYLRERSLSREESLHLAELYESIGQLEYSAHWRTKVQAHSAPSR